MNTIEKITHPVNEIIYSLYNFVKVLLKQPKYINILKNNVIYQNKYGGKRCFILGNGPSLKTVDFSILKDEYTFTVNQITRNPHFHVLQTNFHVWTDPVFFEMDNPVCRTKKYVENILAVNDEMNSPICFFPIDAKEYLEKYGIDKKLNVNYIHTGLSYHDSIRTTFDFTKMTPSMSTVVINVVMLAMYMGFKEIYLLGCDSTGIMGDINKELGIRKDDHAYAIDRMDYGLINKDFEESFRTWANIFHQYKWIAEVCRKKKVKLVNCTEHSILNVLEYQELNDVVLSGKYNG